MTTQEVAAMIDTIGVPSAYYRFDETGQAPPFICFYYANSNDFLADDSNYQKIEHLIIELYTEEKDFALEETVEQAITAHGMVYSREETYIDTERMYEVIYEMDVVITTGGENA